MFCLNSFDVRDYEMEARFQDFGKFTKLFDYTDGLLGNDGEELYLTHVKLKVYIISKEYNPIISKF